MLRLWEDIDTKLTNQRQRVREKRWPVFLRLFISLLAFNYVPRSIHYTLDSHNITPYKVNYVMVQPKSPRKIPRLHATNGPSATARWQAVVNRDAQATSFVYAVLTTKIYCRPSCPARLARRANVDFYDTPSDAEQAGFRPCKRCKPQTLQAVNPQIQLIQRACEAIQAQVESGSKPTLRTLADEANLTPCYFHRLFKKIKGVTPGQYAAVVLNQGGGEPLDENTPVENLTTSGPGMVDIQCDPVTPDTLDGADIANGGDVRVWNDFDVLIAAEANWNGGHWLE